MIEQDLKTAETGKNRKKPAKTGNAFALSLNDYLLCKKNRMVMMEHSDIIIKPYTHRDLCTLYGVSWRVLHAWLTPFQHLIGPKIGHYYTIRQVRIIFTHVGWPEGKAAA